MISVTKFNRAYGKKPNHMKSTQNHHITALSQELLAFCRSKPLIYDIVAIPSTRFSIQYKTNYVLTVAFCSCVKTAINSASDDLSLLVMYPLLV
jgi:hypothetical protein